MSDNADQAAAAEEEVTSALQSLYIIPLSGCLAAHDGHQFRIRYEAAKSCRVLIRPRGRDPRWQLRGQRLVTLQLQHDGAEALPLSLSLIEQRLNHELPASGSESICLESLIKGKKIPPFSLELSWHVSRPGEIRITDISCEKPKPDEPEASIDRYGQRLDDDAEQAISSDDELPAASQAILPAPPAGRGPFGSWETGPVFEPDGFFRVEADENGHQWLVTPGGSVMRALGCHGVSTEAASLPARSTAAFAELPEKDGELAAAWRNGSKEQPFLPEAYPAMCYRPEPKGHFVNFYIANLIRQHGLTWHATWCQQTQQRFQSLGLNALGTRSDLELVEKTHFPYVAEADRICPRDFKELVARPNHRTFPLAHMPDVFHFNFRKRVRGWFKALRALSQDPQLLGYQVGTTTPWETFTHPFMMPRSWQSRRTFVKEIKAQYETIEALNEAWGTTFESFRKFEQFQTAEPVDLNELGQAACDAFLARFAGQYTSILCKELRFSDRNHLIWGSHLPSVDLRPGVLEAICTHIDVLCLSGDGLDADDLSQLAENTRKPLCLTLSSDSHRAADLIAHPAVVGLFWHRFIPKPDLAGDAEATTLCSITGALAPTLANDLHAAALRAYPVDPTDA